jgi:hypothetical protein
MIDLILIGLGAVLGAMLATGLGIGRPSGRHLADLRDAYQEGVLHGHLTTTRGEFRCADLSGMADEWLDNRIADAKADELPANFI